MKVNLILENNDLPFYFSSFIQNILSAVAACISLDIDNKNIVEGEILQTIKQKIFKTS